MKKAILILGVLCLLFFTKAQAQSCPIPEPLNRAEAVGTYEGNYLIDGEMKPFKIAISNKGGTLKTEIALGSSGYIDAKTVLCPREDLHITITKNGKELEFRGRPENGKLAGNFFYTSAENKRVSALFSLTKQ